MAYVYHYCKYDTFEKIIVNKTLRLNNIRNSNDKLEMKHQIEQYKHVRGLSEYFNYADNRYWERMYDFIADITEVTECYASCFSSSNDKLSQWERYAEGGKGVSICFDRYELETYLNAISESIKLPIEDDKYAVAALYYMKIKYEKITKWFYPSNLAEYYNDIKEYLKRCAFTKHQGFSEEKEFRISLIFNRNYADKLFYNINDYISNNKYKTDGYIDIKIPMNLIKEVCLGPIKEKKLDDVVEFLNSNDVSIKVTESTIPYSPQYEMIPKKVIITPLNKELIV